MSSDADWIYIYIYIYMTYLRYLTLLILQLLNIVIIYIYVCVCVCVSIFSYVCDNDNWVHLFMLKHINVWCAAWSCVSYWRMRVDYLLSLTSAPDPCLMWPFELRGQTAKKKSLSGRGPKNWLINWWKKSRWIWV